jgi:hypothetical protein
VSVRISETTGPLVLRRKSTRVYRKIDDIRREYLQERLLIII